MLIQNYAPTAATIETPTSTPSQSTVQQRSFDDSAELGSWTGLHVRPNKTRSALIPSSVNWVYGTPYMGDADKIYRLVFHSMDQGEAG